MSLRHYYYLIVTDQEAGLYAFVVKIFLRLASFLYVFFVRMILGAYAVKLLPVHDLEKPVLSVGNITWGGVGKTPFVEWLTEYFLSRNLKPAILTRGYMPQRRRWQGCPPESDEVLMLRRRFPQVPVVIGKDRVRGAKAVLRRTPVGMFILDDGFQQWGIRKKLDIVLIDATNPFGNGFLLPRGPLREPLSSLKRADIFVITKAHLERGRLDSLTKKLNRVNPQALVVESVHQPRSLVSLLSQRKMDFSLIAGQNVCLVSSIGDPASFERTVQQQGAVVKERFYFMDHECFLPSDLQRITEACQRQGIKQVIITAKDAPKLHPGEDPFFSDLQILILNMVIQITRGREAFVDRVNSVLHC